MPIRVQQETERVSAISTEGIKYEGLLTGYKVVNWATESVEKTLKVSLRLQLGKVATTLGLGEKRGGSESIQN